MDMGLVQIHVTCLRVAQPVAPALHQEAPLAARLVATVVLVLVLPGAAFRLQVAGQVRLEVRPVRR